MEGLKLDISKSGVSLTPAQKEKAQAALSLLYSRQGAGNDFLGWVTLPTSITASEIARIEEVAEALRSRAEVIVCIGIGGSYGYGNLLNNGEFNGAVYVMAQIPLSDWGKTARKMQRLEYQMEKAENERDFLQQQILLQIRKLWLDLTVAWDQLQIARKSEATARVSVEKLNAYYRAGMSPLSELLQAQTQLRSVADKCVDQKIAYRNALQDYLSRCGAGRDE